MRDFTIPFERPVLEAEAKMLASIDKIIKTKMSMKRFATGSLYSITQKKKTKFRSVLK